MVASGLPSLVPVLNIPIAAADTVVLTKNQAMMVYRLALAFGAPPEFQRRMMEITPVIGAAVMWRQVAGGLVGLIPGYGIVPKTAVAFAGTWITGRAAELYYSTGFVSKDDLRRFSEEAMARAQAMAGEMARRAREARDTASKATAGARKVRDGARKVTGSARKVTDGARRVTGGARRLTGRGGKRPPVRRSRPPTRHRLRPNRSRPAAPAALRLLLGPEQAAAGVDLRGLAHQSGAERRAGHAEPGGDVLQAGGAGAARPQRLVDRQHLVVRQRGQLRRAPQVLAELRVAVRLRDLRLVPQRVRVDAQVGGGEVAADRSLERDLVDGPAAQGAGGEGARPALIAPPPGPRAARRARSRRARWR